MQNNSYIWMDGALVPFDQAKIHLLTHTLHYGAGAFEGINIYETIHGPAVFRLNEHLERLYSSIKVFGKEIPYTKQELSQAILATITANKISSGYVRPLVYFGQGPMRLTIEKNPVCVAIATWQWDKHLGDNAVKVMIPSMIRLDPRSSLIDKKIIGHYVNSILTHQEARKKGYDEALLLDYQGAVAEGSAANFFLVKNNTIQTPALGTILPGITRDCVLEIAKSLAIPIQELKLYPCDIKNASEAFFTGTATEICPIKVIENTIFDYEYMGPITQKIAAEFKNIVQGKNAKFNHWLTLVNC